MPFEMMKLLQFCNIFKVKYIVKKRKRDQYMSVVKYPILQTDAHTYLISLTFPRK